MRMNIPVKVKEVKYPKSFGKTTGGVFTNALLFISEDIIEIKYDQFKILKYLFNQLQIRFEKDSF